MASRTTIATATATKGQDCHTQCVLLFSDFHFLLSIIFDFYLLFITCTFSSTLHYLYFLSTLLLFALYLNCFIYHFLYLYCMYLIISPFSNLNFFIKKNISYNPMDSLLLPQPLMLLLLLHFSISIILLLYLPMYIWALHFNKISNHYTDT